MSRKTRSRRRSTRPILAQWAIARVGVQTTSALLALAFFLASPTIHAASTNPALRRCGNHECGLFADGAYANLVIGRLDHVGTAVDMTTAFHWAKAYGYWKHLPASVQPYLRDVKLVTIAVPQGLAIQRVTLFMLQTEFHAAPYHVGDLVRYAPHDAAHDETAAGSPADLALFHGLTGCLATLCQQGDKVCLARYRQGAFTTTHGQAVSLKTGRLIHGGARIDPTSLLQVH